MGTYGTLHDVTRELYISSAVRDAIKRRMPSALLGPKDSKTHHALDDAKGHADLLLGLLRWQDRGR